MKIQTSIDHLVAGGSHLELFVDPAAPGKRIHDPMHGANRLFHLPVGIACLLLLTPPAHAFFSRMGLRWAYILALSFGISFSLTPVVAHLAGRWGILDLPDPRKNHGRATPLLGGAAVFSGFVVSLVANGMVSPQLIALLSATMILFVVGVFDDWREVSAGLKLMIQLVCTAMVMSSGIVLQVLPSGWGTWSTLGNWLLTVMWIVGITNAMNFFDGMDGLASGLGAIIAFFQGAVAFQTDQPFLGWIAVAMLGACAGFLPYNLRWRGPASIFLGDAGSTVIGFALACIAVYGDWADGQPFLSLVSPLLIFWVLIFDMVYISIDRIATGKVVSFRGWIEYVGRDHLHHRLADVLGCRRNSVLFIFLMSLCLGTSALMLRRAGTAEAVLLVLQALIVVVLISFLERRGRSKRGNPDPPPRGLRDGLGK